MKYDMKSLSKQNEMYIILFLDYFIPSGGNISFFTLRIFHIF